MSQPAAAQEEWVLDGVQEADPIQANDATDPGVEEETPPPSVDDLAKELGWKPLKDWKGPTDGWTPADQYLRTTFAKQRQASERIKQLSASERDERRKADELALRLERLERTTGVIMEENERRVRTQVKREFEAAKKAAARENDDEAYEKLSAEEDRAYAEIDKHFKQQKPQEVDPQRLAQEMLSDPITGKFWREHPWVAADNDVYEYVYAVADDAAAAGKTKAEQIAIVKQMLRAEFPERFEQHQPRRGQAQTQAPLDDEGDGETEVAPRDPDTGQFVPKRDAAFYPQQRRQPAQVQGGSRVGGARMSPEQQAVNSLPPEARRVFAEQKAAGRFQGDIVKFAKIYNGETSNVLD